MSQSHRVYLIIHLLIVALALAVCGALLALQVCCIPGS